MLVPLEIHFHNMDSSAAIEAAVRKRAAKLELFAGDIVSCRVTVEAPHKHHHKGNLYSVTIDLRYPGGEVVASRQPSAHKSHEDFHVALRDAFKTVRRQLQDRMRTRRGDVKTHDGPPQGRIVSMQREKNCGRILTADGREIYFHRNSVLNASFDRLEPGIEVRFNEEPGDQGPQASSVHVIG
jgi:ribosome-associated translation inhibitor RaiA/cold shock CspA family protein